MAALCGIPSRAPGALPSLLTQLFCAPFCSFSRRSQTSTTPTALPLAGRRTRKASASLALEGGATVAWAPTLHTCR